MALAADNAEVSLDKVVSFEDGSPSSHRQQDLNNNNCGEQVSISTDDSGAMNRNMVQPTQSLSSLEYLKLCSLICIPPALFIIAFSGVGYGLENTKLSFDYEDKASYAVGGVIFLVFFMYIFDANLWHTADDCMSSSTGKILQMIGFCAVLAGSLLALLMLIGEHPWGPLCVFTVFLPLYIIGIRQVLYSDREKVNDRTFAKWIYIVLMSLGTSLSVLSLGWAMSGEENSWDNETRAMYSYEAGCTPDFSENAACQDDNGEPCFFNSAKTSVNFDNNCSSQCVDIYDDCTCAFIIWANPALSGVSILVLGGMVGYLLDESTLKNNVNQEEKMNDKLTLIIKLAGFILFVIWVVASLLGAGAGIGSAMIAFAMSVFVGMGIILLTVFYKVYKEGEASMKEWIRKYDSYIDIAKGLFLVTSGPFLIAYLFLSAANQATRKVLVKIGVKQNRSVLEEGMITKRTSEQVEVFKTWNHTQVLTYAIYWGVAYITLDVVVTRCTYVFLSWLIEYCNELDVYTVTGIVILVGMILFLLPPVPGVPIYLAGGIILGAVGNDEFGWVGVAFYTNAVCLFIKLLACTMQQKLIGELLGTYVSVKQLCQVNSEFVRGMKYILSEPTLTMRKVAILVGGPDWPTSVLCGIMGLDLLPILLGTIPVIFLQAPTVLAGMFLYMSSEVDSETNEQLYPWADTLGTVFTVVAGGVMFYMMFTAGNSIDKALTDEREKILEIELDPEVTMANEIREWSNNAFEEANKWERLPKTMKIFLVSSVAMVSSGCYILLIFNSTCFVEFDLLDTIEDKLDNNVFHLVKPLGWIALSLVAMSSILLFVTQKNSQIRAKRTTNEPKSRKVHTEEEIIPARITAESDPSAVEVESLR